MSESTSQGSVLEKAKQFAEKLRNCAEVQRFHLAENQVNQSKSVQNLIDTIRKKQKELVHAKHYQKVAYQKQLESELEQLNRQLDSLPIVREYQQSQVELNDLLQTIQRILIDSISETIQVEHGKEAPTGCGSGGPCGCSTHR